jgi:D-sedoheptulose 7-phosphate isomerase
MNQIKNIIQKSIDAKQQILASEALMQSVQDISDLLVETFKSGKRVWFCGNGGSAADAQHLAAELSGRFYFDRAPLPAEAMHVNTSYLTAVANDYSYDEIYARYLRGVGSEGDVLVGISTSGNSGNILRAQEVAKDKGIKVVSFTGATGGKMKDNSDFLLNVPSTDTPRIQESHIMLGHIICELVEADLFSKPE